MGFVKFVPDHHFVSGGLAVILGTLFLAVWVHPGLLHGTALIWQNTFMSQFFVWNLVTGNFVETSLVKLLISLGGITALSPTVEESLTPLGTLVYLLLVSTACGVFTSMGIFALYIITRFEYLLSMEVHGSFGILSALIVAVVQRNPEELIFPPASGMPEVQLQMLPVFVLLCSAVAYFAGLTYLSLDFPFVCVGTFVGWALLRFYKPNADGTYGDVSSQFQIVMFLPPVCRRVVKPFCDFVYGVMLLLGCFKDRKNRLPPDTSGGLGLGAHGMGIGGLALGLGGSFAGGGLSSAVEPLMLQSKPVDPVTERRRARAMKLLDEKFEKLTSGSRAGSSSSMVSSSSVAARQDPAAGREGVELESLDRGGSGGDGSSSRGGGGGGGDDAVVSTPTAGGGGGVSDSTVTTAKSPTRVKGRRSLSPVLLSGAGGGSSRGGGGGGGASSGVPETKGKNAD